MADFDFNVLGNFSNKVGNVVGFQWKGMQVVRGYKAKVANPNTDAQRLVRNKFTLLSNLAKQFRSTLLNGMKPLANSRKSTIYGEFVRLNKSAVTGNLQSLTVDYASLVVARGGATPVVFGDPGFSTPLTVSVPVNEANLTVAGAHSDDLIFIAAYCPDMHTALCTTGMQREDAQSSTIQLRVPNQWQGLRVYVYGFVVDKQNGVSSDTTSLGYGDIA